VARLWSRGHTLYGPVAWVDRPQGLVAAYRLVAVTGWDPTARLLAIAAAALATAGVGAAAWALAGRRAAVVAAALFAVLSPAPHLEGFTANGELLASGFTAIAVAAVAWWRIRGDRLLLILAGLATALGLLMKQSAFDGLVVALVVVLAGRRTEDRRIGRDLVALSAGVAVPAVLALAHAATLGLGDWWFAMIGHRGQTDSIIHGPFGHRFSLFFHSLPPFAKDLGPLAVLTVPGLIAARRQGRLLLPLTWLLAALAGFAVGGLYHPHYWMQLVAPLCLLAAMGVEAIAARSGRAAVVATAVVVGATLVVSLPVYLASSGTKVSEMTLDDRRVQLAKPIGRLIAGLTGPDDRIAAVWANAAVYWYADRTPAFRYLWLGPLSQIHGAAATARGTITGPDPPTAVVITTKPSELDPRGEVARALADRYVLVRHVGPYPVYVLRSALPRDAPVP
jgi:4-amino-4-deoxy-L-arabinose transferase-like glycosyltransferase